MIDENKPKIPTEEDCDKIIEQASRAVLKINFEDKEMLRKLEV
jgi:hypothetical protein